MSIYRLSPRGRTNANSPYNRLQHKLLTCHQKAEFTLLVWSFLGGCCCHTFFLQSLSAHCRSILLLLHSTHALLKSHHGTRLCSTKELILTRFPASITPFCTTVATTLAPSATGPALEDKHLMQKVCSQIG